MKFTTAKNITKGVIVACLMFVFCHPACAQKATEKFIPLGKSPGVSGRTSEIGDVQSVNAKTYSLTVKLANGTKEIHIDKKTKIYIDKSDRNETNLDGKWDDIVPGMLIEVKYADEKTGPVDWVKLRMK